MGLRFDFYVCFWFKFGLEFLVMTLTIKVPFLELVWRGFKRPGQSKEKTALDQKIYE